MMKHDMKASNSLLRPMPRTKGLLTVNKRIHHRKKRKKWRLSWRGKVPKKELILALSTMQRSMKIRVSFHRKTQLQTNRWLRLPLLHLQLLPRQYQAKRRDLTLIWGSSTMRKNTTINLSSLTNKNSFSNSNNNKSLNRKKEVRNPSLT